MRRFIAVREILAAAPDEEDEERDTAGRGRAAFEWVETDARKRDERG